MLNNNHIKTNAATSFAISSFFISHLYLIYLPLLLIGGYLGQILGPDLDINSSIPNKKGGKQLILIILSIIFLIDNDTSKITIIPLLISIVLFIAQYKYKQSNLYLNFLPVALIIIFIIANPISLFSSTLFFLIFTIIMLKKNPHRGATHSLFMIIAILLTLFTLIGFASNGWFDIILKTLVLGYSAGFLTHITMDLLGSKGTALLYPFNKKINGVGLYTVNSGKENAVAYIYIGLCIAFFIFNIFK